jgi:glycosyltransferase involved in cell wall biosynthesis
MPKLTVSVASYRDPDLANTIRSALENAKHPEQLFFSVFSQAEDDEHADLSFVPEANIKYQKAHWSESMGACWAREIANRDIDGDYILQIDSHSRFLPHWDKLIVSAYKKAQGFWGNRIFMTNYPDPFELDDDGEAVLLAQTTFFKIDTYWHEPSEMVSSKWADVVDTTNGDEQFFLSAGCLFSEVSLFKQVPYDPELYFVGEEFSMAMRAYTRGIRLVTPTVKFMLTNYNRANSKRRFHWQDHEQWHQLNRRSYERVGEMMAGNQTGIYGIGSKFLFDQYQKLIGIDFASKRQIIAE